MTDIRMYGGGHVFLNSLNQKPEPFEDFDDEYFTLGLNIGLSIPLFNELDQFEGRLENEISYSYTGGDDQNLGSHRNQMGLQFGWKQNLWSVPFVRVMTGIGFNLNELNFGFGAPLKEEVNVTFMIQAELGVDICSKRRAFCFSPFVGYKYETAVNSPFYESDGVLFSFALSGSWNTVDSAVHVHEVNALKRNEEELAEKIRTLEREKSLLESGLTSSRLESQALLKEINSLKNPALKPSADFLNAAFFFTKEGEADPDTDIYITEKDGRLVNEDLDEIAASIRALPRKIRIHGHALPSGNPAGDRILSLRFAQAVKEYLVLRGIDASDLLLDGRLINAEGKALEVEGELPADAEGASVHGSSDTTYPPDDKALGRKCAKNRCVSFEIISADGRAP